MSTKRVFNETRHCYWKRNQAARAVENCAAEWIEFNVIIRDLTLAESISARHAQAQLREPLPFAELPNLVFRFSDYGAVIKERIRAFEANQFCELATA